MPEIVVVSGTDVGVNLHFESILHFWPHDGSVVVLLRFLVGVVDVLADLFHFVRSLRTDFTNLG